MSRQTRLTVWLTVLGLAIGAALFGYLEFTNYSRLNPMLLSVSIVLCPPSLLSMLFMDIEPHTVEAVMGWSVIALINAALYGTIGAGVGRYLWKSARSTA